MQGSEIRVYKKIESEYEAAKQHNTNRRLILKIEYIHAVFAFLMSRAMLFGQLCPFGVSFFSASYISKKCIYGAIGVLIGTLTAGAGVHTLQYVVAIGVVFLYKFFVEKENQYGAGWTAFVTGAGNFVGAVMTMLFERFLIYSLLLAVAESIMIGLVTMLFANVNAIRNSDYEKLRIVNREEMFGIVMLFGLAACGLTDIVDFGIVNIGEIIWSLLILSFAYAGGVTAGLGAGTVIGLIGAMSQSDPLCIIGLYSVCGLAAGFAKSAGKLCVAAIYLLCAVGLGLSTTVFVFGQASLSNLLIASVIFAFIPKKFYEKHFAFEGDCFTPMQQKVYSKRVNTLLSEKFQSLAATFQGMSDTVKNLSENKTCKFSLDYGKVIDDSVEKVCAQCSMRVYCWEKDSEKTGKSMAAAISKLKRKGFTDRLDLGNDFQRTCIHSEELTAAMNHAYTMRRLNAVWDNQVNETRILLGQQYSNFADVMQEMSKDITQKVIYESTFKHKISTHLQNAGFQVEEVYLYEREDESYDVEVQIGEMNDEISVQLIEKAVSNGMHCVMRVSVIDEYNNSIRLEPQYKFVIRSSIATVKKDGEEKNGDSYAVFNMKNNRCALLLSDGMGSGENANAESVSTVSLLKKLLTVGFDVEAAVRLVNSALVLKSGSESFATVDMVVVDLLSGNAEFFKVGAARGYIKHVSGVTTIGCAGLPVGILAETDLKKEKYTLVNGDCLILVSDGICDGKNAGELANYIDSLTSFSTDEIAKKMLNYALTNQKGKANDDMTVIVAKIVENQKSEIV